MSGKVEAFEITEESMTDEKGQAIVELFDRVIDDCNKSPVPNGIILGILMKICARIAVQKGIPVEDFVKMALLNMEVEGAFEGAPEDTNLH